MRYFRFCVKRWGKTKKNKLKGDTTIILGDKSIILGGKIIFLVYLRLFLKNLRGHSSPTQHVGPPLDPTAFHSSMAMGWFDPHQTGHVGFFFFFFFF
jgi:hypothetical protein